MTAGGLPPLRFNRMPGIGEVLLGRDRTCLVFDDVLADPAAWVDFAAAHASRFVESQANAYPGPELPLPYATIEALDTFFAQHARSVRRPPISRRAHGRLDPRSSHLRLRRIPHGEFGDGYLAL